jgi:hypothetical protein
VIQVNILDLMLPPNFHIVSCAHRNRADYLGFVFCTRASSELRQISAAPSADRVRWIAADSSHASSSCGTRFEITPTPSIAIMSLSAAHCGHHARSELFPRRTNKESVSIVIFVCLAMAETIAQLARNRMKSPYKPSENF